MTVQEADHVNGINSGDTITIDSSNSWIKYGNSSCLVVGTTIEAKGGIADLTTMIANVIEIESDCASHNYDFDSDADHDSSCDSDEDSDCDSDSSDDDSDFDSA